MGVCLLAGGGGLPSGRGGSLPSSGAAGAADRGQPANTVNTWLLRILLELLLKVQKGALVVLDYRMGKVVNLIIHNVMTGPPQDLQMATKFTSAVEEVEGL